MVQEHLVLDTPELFADGARRLAEGRGPFAVDTERASGFRFDDRVFLLQVRRRGAGTFLFAPEGHRDELSRTLAPVLTGEQWVVHAAVTDLPALAWLQLTPGSLFDTEVAARIAGFDRVNLAAVVEAATGTTIKKGHGWEDWSTTPLPEDWLRYAAEDVDYLLEAAEFLAEVLDNAGKLEWAEAEFAHIVLTHACPPPERDWRRTKGVLRLKKPLQLAIARELWYAREELAIDSDTNPSRLLPDKAIVALAEAETTAPQVLARKLDLKPAARRRAGQYRDLWLQAISQGFAVSVDERPRPVHRYHEYPPHSLWAECYPEAHERLRKVNEELTDLSVRLEVPEANLVSPKALRALVWAATESHSVHTLDDARAFLASHDARGWQIDLVSPLIRRSVLR
ncbi:hypothetical protein CATYP_04535 [Corynebacterium atypicum]|uniref:HRDC domain-containing protein n=1 Tax=Corynebacterium atypicum TaxID=191610 RepID=A0ABN4DCA6_9CORY|nr:HRDC domain-containing protein [Corynebacterium atypicum]AIG64035.1 hypothetical protein CATYP_04535 [Corynebacterium atypicum]